ncbi:hypothetical protein [Thalassobellus suaedae]|uniref:Uncharacterized protein n=1 Tax=Thalassobellus suaedae TaxID=3074124 RepID=A0ABY9XTB1_9FLAO|nr:hypothetical protein RHP51_19520 [Flavobacteriaceae bacterium HL-DH14]
MDTSPTLTGTPLAPTATTGTNSTQIATTAFVSSAVNTATTGNFVDLTTNQTIAGTKTFSSNVNVKGLVIGLGTNGIASNTSIGVNALVSNSAGINNVAIGWQAGFSITGSNNVAIGSATNRNPAEGDSNVAIGNNANYQGTSGANNISLGTLAYRQGDSGSNNIALGLAALYQETTGSNNIALGNNSSRNNNGGEGNVTLGYQAGNTITTGDYNVIVGYDADVSSGALTNAIAIGNGAIVTASNTIQLGNTSISNVKTSGTVTAGAITIPNTDGTSGQVLATNGSGTLTWSTPSNADPIREVADEITATASQTSFTLTQTPSANSKVKMYINGIRISNTAYSTSGTTLTYVPANNGNNGGYALTAGDRIQFDYYY